MAIAEDADGIVEYGGERRYDEEMAAPVSWAGSD